jgi:lipid II isoglutaminyl synthase (glutamine-hydrolysing)
VTDAAVRIAVVYPELLGTYGDGGNAVVLAQRLRWRGIPSEIIEVELGDAVPRSADMYVLGGGEDAPQALAAEELRRVGALQAALEGGAVVLAVCAGLQVIGERFLGPGGESRAGVGLVDIETVIRLRTRAVGEIVVEPAAALDLPLLSGYENHAGATTLGPGIAPLGRVRRGIGNGGAGSVGAVNPDAQRDAPGDGCIVGRVVGTYLHGPVLARNPALADRLLGWVVGSALPELPGGDPEAEELRIERLAAAFRGDLPGAARRLTTRLARRGRSRRSAKA